MIIWLNGPFGIGKTTLANILHKRIENSYLYDPELLGDFLQHQLPQTVCPENFQDYSVWRQSTYKIVFDLATKTDKIIIIPISKRILYEHRNKETCSIRKGLRRKRAHFVQFKK